MSRAQELADLLRSRRERLQPGDVGLPASARRRTRGLRREEVAQLASISTTYYTFLEQGATSTHQFRCSTRWPESCGSGQVNVLTCTNSPMATPRPTLDERLRYSLPPLPRLSNVSTPARRTSPVDASTYCHPTEPPGHCGPTGSRCRMMSATCFGGPSPTRQRG